MQMYMIDQIDRNRSILKLCWNEILIGARLNKFLLNPFTIYNKDLLNWIDT